MQTDTNREIDQMTENVIESTELAVDPSVMAPAYNGVDRNAWILGWNPQQELWNGRLAMIGFVAYLLWDWAGYSVVRNVLHLIR